MPSHDVIQQSISRNWQRKMGEYSNLEYCYALGLAEESLQIEDPLFDMIKSMVCQAYGLLNKSNVN